MRHPIIQFLYFRGCPLAAAAREALEAALAECGIQRYDEIDILDPAAPENLRGWGSPTILIDGIDAAGESRGDAVGCRCVRNADASPGAVNDRRADQERPDSIAASMLALPARLLNVDHLSVAFLARCSEHTLPDSARPGASSDYRRRPLTVLVASKHWRRRPTFGTLTQ